jgi:serine/threonine protein kinase
VTRLLGGRYAIERRIGEGGMAEVLLARDQARGGAPVVVKRCRAHLAQHEETGALFLREARLASLIHHPNVVEVEATGDDEGLPYLVMEYLQGFTIREIFIRAQKDGGVPQDLAALIILGAARGLHAAHTAVDERGVPLRLMHRDVSPHNLFVTEAGVVKVLDFGIAKGVNEATMTRAGHVKGKASYLAPEQLDPEAKIDARADLFSLGIVSWELFTGKRLFRKTTETETILAIRNLKVERPEVVQPGLDDGYADVVMKLLARHPEQRPPSADDVVRRLEATLGRRAPALDEAALAKFVARIKEIDPHELTRPGSSPDARRAPRPAAGNPSVPKIKVAPAATLTPFLEVKGAAWAALAPKVGKAPSGIGAAPPRPEEQTAVVAPPVAEWMSATGRPPPVDGSVVGMFAVAGATADGDPSGGFDAVDLDTGDILIEASQAGSKPQPAALPPRDFGPPPVLISDSVLEEAALVPEPASHGSSEAEIVRSTSPTSPASFRRPDPNATVQTRRAGGDDLPARARHTARALVSAIEARIGTHPKPAIIAAILAVSLLAGMVTAFAITAVLR